MIGQTLSHFKITAKLGEGGMGEVYRAEDTKLGREVAIKVLPEAFTQDPERFARFEREAKVLASLNHSNIAAIHDLAEDKGTHFLVLELAEGEDLAARLARGPISIEDALPLALQIAEALEAAHEKGIVHRDLKPANVMVGPDGIVKVLDFGLAKAAEPKAGDADLTRSPTLTAQMTQAGIILGTAGYMSPEQARGQEVDKQTDIWAFGVVLYELLTGNRLFGGPTVTDTLAAILEREPDWEALPKATPPLARSLVRRCLEKDQKRRLHDIADARIELEDAQRLGEHPETHVTVENKRSLLPWLVSGLLALLAGVAVLYSWRTVPVNREVVRATLNLPSGHGQPQRGRTMALSPDGGHLVYLSGGRRANERQLYLRDLASGETIPIPGTEGAEGLPSFSPDGLWIGFTSTSGELKKARLEGAGASTISDGVLLDLGNRGLSWSADGSVVVGQTTSGLLRISPEGGTPEVLSTLDGDKDEESHRWPDVLPDGKGVIYSAKISGNFDDSRIMAQSFETGESHFLLNASEARYAPTGHLIYAKADTLFAVSFDSDRMEVVGTGVPVQTGVIVASAGPGAASFTFSNNGTLVYLARPIEQRRLVLVDLAGNVEPLGAPQRRYLAARFSPNGERLALSIGGDTGAFYEVYSYELAQERLSLLASRFKDASGTEFQFKGGLAFHPDGETLAVNGTAPGEQQTMFSIKLDGSGGAKRLTEPPGFDYPEVWSADGRHLFYMGGFGLFEVSSQGSDSRRLVDDFQPHADLSRDMRWLAYEACEARECEIFLTSYPQAKGRHQVSLEGGRTPLWAPDGRTLYFIEGTRMMAAEVQTSPTLSIGKPRFLFEGNFYSEGAGIARGYDLSPDGKKFLMIESVGEVKLNEFQIVLNWFDEVNRIAPKTRTAPPD